VIESFSRFGLLQIGIETGRTHQIRVHLSSLRHPIVGDTLYGAPGGVTAFPNPGRFLLHASKLAFDSPSAGKRLCFESSLPPEFLRVLECLRSATARMDAI
jgi:23S rRNA pseudouridine1911/1915/1917 synthase